jgi:hypothetical protein
VAVYPREIAKEVVGFVVVAVRTEPRPSRPAYCPGRRAASSAGKFGTGEGFELDGAERLPSALPLAGAG